jgi:dihydroxyacetone kinase
MELAIVARHAVSFLESNAFTVERIFAGTFLSSLDMAGISISVLGLNDDRLRWLDASTSAPAWPNAPKQHPGKPAVGIVREGSNTGTKPAVSSVQTEAATKTRNAIEAACKALIAAEGELTEMDRVTGDGDLGASMARAAKAVQNALSSYPLDNIPATLKALGHTLRRELGGSSGPLYGVLFLRCGSILENRAATGPALWADALAEGCQAISELGGAKPGDRTMLDALDPFVQTLQQGAGLNAALEAAERGVEATAHPDPGAKAVAIWLRAACEPFFPR